jgi:hypothetical protein
MRGSAITAAIVLAATVVAGGVGVAAVWIVRRRSMLSILNFYPPAAVSAIAVIATRSWTALAVLLPLGAPWVAGCAAPPRHSARRRARAARGRTGPVPLRSLSCRATCRLTMAAARDHRSTSTPARHSTRGLRTRGSRRDQRATPATS